MKNRYSLRLELLPKIYSYTLILVSLLACTLTAGNVFAQGFNIKKLQNTNIKSGTGIDFGPDGRVYTTQQDGLILVYKIARTEGATPETATYAATGTELINLVKNKPNHDDDGKLSDSSDAKNQRQVTGIVVTGTAVKPVLYVSSSDPRIGGPTGGDRNLDTNSGTISRLTWIHTAPPSETDFSTLKDGDLWEKVDIVRGMPRSEENHATNGLRLATINNRKYIFVSQGGLTNAGSPSRNFTKITEYALSGAILSVDLTAIEAMPIRGTAPNQYIYDIPTVDDPTRTNIPNPDYDASVPGSPQTIDENDPFGGNDGLNQAKIVPGGPVQVYSPGYRNTYDLVITKDRRMYVTDNGANPGWGGFPENEGTPNVTNNYWNSGEPGTNADSTLNGVYVNNQDHLHLVTGAGTIDDYTPGTYYGGHPNPIRANPAGAGLYTQFGANNSNDGVFRTSKDDPQYPLPADWPPVPVDMAHVIEGDYLSPGDEDGATTVWQKNCNAIAEYTASNLGGAYQGNLLAGSSSKGGVLYRLQLNPDGSKKELDQDFAKITDGGYILGIVCQGDNDPYAGTIWVASYSGGIQILEPADYNGNPVGNCSDEDSPDLDGDQDGFSNADEIDNGTNPCSGTSFPDDFDKDYLSDLNDSDDDNDGIEDHLDVFQRGKTNGLDQVIGNTFELFNDQFGFYNLGFTGMMTNQDPADDYLNWLDVENPDNPDQDDVYGGAAGVITVKMTAGDALGALNTQQKAFQMGIKVDKNTFPFTADAMMIAPFKNLTGDESQGVFIGTGDQDNYIKVVLDAAGISVVVENAGTPTATPYPLPAKPSSNFGILFSVDPGAGTVQPKYILDEGEPTNLGTPITITGKLLEVIQQSDKAMSLGIIGTSKGSAAPFFANWDYFKTYYDKITAPGEWYTITPYEGVVGQKIVDNEPPTKRMENAFVQAGNNFYLLGGRGVKKIEKYNLTTKTWSTTNTTLNNIHHFQAVAYNGLIYIIGAFTEDFPAEKPVPNVLIYDPVADKLITGPEIPADRRRGAAGAVVYNDKIYLVAGIQNGHIDGWVPWLDEFDPATNTWTQKADAPRARDHFYAAVYNGEIYLAGGRTSFTDNNGNFDYSQTIGEVDVYNFANNTWRTLPNNIPTQRAGAPSAVLGRELFIMGGESKIPTAHPQMEALDLEVYTWRSATDLLTPRHATAAIVNNGGIFITGGSNAQGGGSTKELDSQEAFFLTGQKDPTGTPITAGTLTASADSLDFGTPEAGTAVSQTLTLTNSGGSQGILIEGMTISGSTDFSLVAPPTYPLLLATGSSIDVEIQLAQSVAEKQTGTLAVAYTGSAAPLSIGLNNGDTVVIPPPDTTAVEPLALINAGGPKYTDVDGKVWAADQYFTGGKTFKANPPVEIAGTDNDALYQTERYGDMTYEIPVENGTYDVNLHFAEIFHITDGIGKRVFDVSIENGLRTLKNYDIVADGGAATAVIKEFKGIPIEDSSITIQFINTGTDNAKISAISVYPSLGEGLVIQDIPNRSDVVGTEPELTVVAIGGEGNLAFSATNLPDGLTIEPTNGMIEGAIAESALAKSPFNVTVTVQDGNSTANKTFTWTIISNIPGDTDGDGIKDELDAFALDANNGNNTAFPVSLNFNNPAGIFVNGFSGMMLDPAGTMKYTDMYTPADVIINAANSNLTINNIPGGDAVEKTNTQKNAFQFGLKAPTKLFIVHTRLVNPFKGKTPKKFQSAGMFIGKGDQDNYLKLVVGVGSGTALRIQALLEEGGVVADSSDISVEDETLLNADFIDLLLHVNPENKTATPVYYVNGTPKDTLQYISVPDAWLTGVMAVGLISTSTTGAVGNANPFTATWEFLDVKNPLATDILTTNALCYGDVGSATITATGGIAPISTIWPNNEDPANLSGGTYAVVIADANGYKVIRTVEIKQSEQIILAITQTKQVTCAENGAVSLVVTGPESFTTTWTDEENNAVDPNDLPAGTYFVHVIDDSTGCDTMSQVTLNLNDEGPVFESVPEDTFIACSDPVPAATEVMATDDCDGDITAILEEIEEDDRIVRTWTATDAAGNEVMAMQIITLECPTGIDDDIAKDHMLKIYPNPSVDKKVNFEVNMDNKDATILIYDVVGKLLIEKKIKTHSTYSMDFSSYTSGTYMIKAYSEDHVVVKRFVLK